MVHRRRKHMLIVGDAEKLCTQRDLGSEIENVPRRLSDGLLQPAGRPCGGVDNLPTEVGPLALYYALLGYPLDRREERAQALMAAHHISQRSPQRIAIE